MLPGILPRTLNAKIDGDFPTFWGGGHWGSEEAGNSPTGSQLLCEAACWEPQGTSFLDIPTWWIQWHAREESPEFLDLIPVISYAINITDQQSKKCFRMLLIFRVPPARIKVDYASRKPITREVHSSVQRFFPVTVKKSSWIGSWLLALSNP